MWIIQYDTNFPGNAQSCFWAQVIWSCLCSAMVLNPLHHPRFSRPGLLDVNMAVALTFCFILALVLGLLSRERSLRFCSLLPCFPALGGLHKWHLQWDISRGTWAGSAFDSYLLLETEHNFGFTSQKELLLAAHPASLCPSHFTAWALLLILFDNIFFLHLANQLTSKPYHI